MSRSTKDLARRRVRARARRMGVTLPHIQGGPDHKYRGQGISGLREASIAGIKLASKPIDTVIESYHVGNGIYKMYKTIQRWWERNA